MKIVQCVIQSLLLAITTMHAVAQPALSRLPQAEPPVISEATKEVIRKQWVANNEMAKNTEASEKITLPKPVSGGKDISSAHSSSKSDNVANQQAYIDEIKQQLPERK